MEYRVPYDPGSPTKNPYVDFDGYVWRGNPPEEVFLEAKNGYGDLLFAKTYPGASDKILKDFVEEARSQIKAAHQSSAGARIEWHFSDKKVADLVAEHFADKDLLEIVVVFSP